MRAEFLTDRFDEYVSGGCPSCASGCSMLKLDSLVVRQWVFCFACHVETPVKLKPNPRASLLDIIKDATAREAFSAIEVGS